MNSRWSRPLIVFATLLVLGLALYGLSASRHRSSATSGLAVSQSATSSLPKRSPVIPSLFIAKGMVPPTNKWFSSLAFSATPQPIFAYPLSFKLNETGYGVSSPPVVATPNAVFGSHLDDVMLNIGTGSHIVQSYDDLSVVIGQNDSAGKLLATTRVTQGSPYVFTKIRQPITATVVSDGVITALGANKYKIVLGKRHYGLYTTAKNYSDTKTITLTAQPDDSISIFALPNDNDESTYFAAAARPITGTMVSYTTTPNKVITTYDIQTQSGASLFAATPNMSLASKKTFGSFTSVLGKQVVYSGNTFTDTQMMPAMPSAELDVSHVTAAQKDDLIAKLKQDTEVLTFVQVDSYFGGKELYRAANLLQLAESLQQTAIADNLKQKLASRMGEWLDPAGSYKRSDRYFYYDSSYKGVVGSLASYGSEGFNDHHFHYGYFIYAAAILSKYDRAFYDAHAAMVNVLISDIASNDKSAQFPKLRVFDAYAGHSWASGNGDFGDGNNQESSSEATNAWYGMYLWSQVAHNSSLASESTWLYSHETRTANFLWLSPPASIGAGSGYSHPTVGIVWGGKVDYSTFFSPRPQAIVGIQLIPMSPGQNYLRSSNVNQIIKSAAPTPADLVGQFNDYLVMYQSLSDPSLALKQARSITDKDLDNGNSMTYLYAWLYSHNK